MRAAAMLQPGNRMSVAGSLRPYGPSSNAHRCRRRPEKARRLDPGVPAGIEGISGRRPACGSRRPAAQAARDPPFCVPDGTGSGIHPFSSASLKGEGTPPIHNRCRQNPLICA